MKRFGRSFLLCCMVMLLLAGTASANSAPPDYLLVIRLSNGPEEPYELELLPEDSRGMEDLEHSYSEGVHRFEGYSMPQEFRVQIVTGSGETWVSEVVTRKALQMGVRVDWAAKTVKTPPAWVAYGLQFLSTLLPTLVIEGAILLLFGYDWRKNWVPFLVVNLVTQGALAAYVSQIVTLSGTNPYSMTVFWMFFMVPAELVIFLVEAFADWHFLRGHSKGRAVGYAAAANLVSYVAGWFIVQAVWEHITRVFWLGI